MAWLQTVAIYKRGDPSCITDQLRAQKNRFVALVLVSEEPMVSDARRHFGSDTWQWWWLVLSHHVLCSHIADGSNGLSCEPSFSIIHLARFYHILLLFSSSQLIDQIVSFKPPFLLRHVACSITFCLLSPTDS